MLRRIIIPLARGLTKLLFRVEVRGREKLPDGGYVIAANHLSFWDPVFIGAYLSKTKITFLAKDELFRFKPFGAFISALGAVPVSRGIRDASVVKNSVDILKGDNVICIFPEGTRIRKGKKASPKKGAVRMANMAGVPIVPVHLKATYRIFSKVYMTVGDPVSMTGEMTNEQMGEKSREIMDAIYSL